MKCQREMAVHCQKQVEISRESSAQIQLGMEGTLHRLLHLRDQIPMVRADADLLEVELLRRLGARESVKGDESEKLLRLMCSANSAGSDGPLH